MGRWGKGSHECKGGEGRSKREGIYVYIELIHFIEQQKPTNQRNYVCHAKSLQSATMTKQHRLSGLNNRNLSTCSPGGLEI